MLLYAAKRLALDVVIVSLAMVRLFAMIHVAPGDPASVALGPRATPEMVEALRARMGLDQPAWVQLWRFYTGAWRGDLGVEVLSEGPVLTVVMEQLPCTLALIAGGIGWSVGLGIPLGCLAAVRRGSPADRIVGVLSVAVIAVPSFVMAIHALLVFSVTLRWLPAIGAGEPGGLALPAHAPDPAVTGRRPPLGGLHRAARARLVAGGAGLEPHPHLAGYGLSERRITYRYALPIAILPTATLLGNGVGQMLSSAVFAEIVFSRPGVGKLVYDAILTRNYPVVTGAVLVTTAFYVLVNVAADLSIGALDPRVRRGL